MKKKAYIYIIMASILWGTSGLFVNYLSDFSLTSLQMTGIRTGTAAIFMAVYALVKNRALFNASPKELMLFFFSGLSLFFTGTFYFMSMQAASVSTAVILMYTAPVFVMIYSVSFLGERLTKTKTLCVGMMILGCALVSGIIGGLKFSFSGIVFGLLAGISYSTYNVITKIQMRKNLNPVSASMYCFIFASVISFVASSPLKIVETAYNGGLLTTGIMIACGIFTCIMPYFLYTLALRTIPAGTASSLAITEPMAATIFSILFLGERPNIFSIFGIILIICSVFLLSRVKE